VEVTTVQLVEDGTALIVLGLVDDAIVLAALVQEEGATALTLQA